MSRTTRTTDDEMVHRAALRIGVQIAIGCAAVVVVVAVISLVFGHHRHQANGPALDGDGDDNAFFSAVLIAGAAGVLVAGALGWYAARRAVRPLADALQLQRRFVADAGHELRTPLTILHTRAQLLARKIPPEHPAKRLSDEVLQDSRVLAEIVDELLVSAQLGANPANAVTVDLADVIRDVARSMQPLADEAQVELVADTEDQATVLGSAASLRRAVLALADNALAHTHPGGRVSISTRHDSYGVEIAVADDGDGIDPALVPRLTERFARGPAAPVGTATATGPARRRFGLGLALVQQVVEAHRGTLTLTGAPGRGTVATIKLPEAGAGGKVY